MPYIICIFVVFLSAVPIFSVQRFTLFIDSQLCISVNSLNGGLTNVLLV